MEVIKNGLHICHSCHKKKKKYKTSKESVQIPARKANAKQKRASLVLRLTHHLLQYLFFNFSVCAVTQAIGDRGQNARPTRKATTKKSELRATQNTPNQPPPPAACRRVFHSFLTLAALGRLETHPRSDLKMPNLRA